MNTNQSNSLNSFIYNDDNVTCFIALEQSIFEKRLKNSEETKILLQIFIECKHMTHICRIQGYDSIMGG